MSAHELVVVGPRPITAGVEQYEYMDPVTSARILLVERSSSERNKYTSVCWNPNFDLERALAGINQVYINQKANLVVDPIRAPDDDLFLYEFEAPLTSKELLQEHPDGIKWMRVGTPQSPHMPDFFIPLNRRVTSPAGIIKGEPSVIEWRDFLPLYQQTADAPYDEDSVHRALITTGVEII